MANTNFDVIVDVKSLKKLAKLRDNVKDLGKKANAAFGGMISKLNKLNGSLDKNNKFLSRSADRVGFMAFQFTFLEGIAKRVLGSIQRFFSEVITEGSEGLESMIRAVSQAGIDISGDTLDSARAVKFLNDAILDLGGGGTIFNVVEVADAVREIGKATDLTGTEFEKANKLIGVTTQVLRLMRIEQVDSSEAARTIIKTMNNFNLSLEEAARVTSVMINVNQSSAITLNELARSFGFASSQAVEFGLDVEETGALLGVLGNRLGQGAGAAGRNFRQLLIGLKNNALKFNPTLDSMGVALLDVNGNIKPFLQFLKETKFALDDAGKSSDAFRIFLQQQIGLEVRAADALAKLTQATTEEIERAVEAARTGDSSFLEELLESTPEAGIKKIKNAISVLKLEFVTGLAPAIAQVSEMIVELTRDRGLQEMMIEFGAIMGDEVVPIVAQLIKGLKSLLKFFQKHRAVLLGLIKLMFVFIGLLVATLIVATVGKIVAAFVSILLKLSIGLSAVALNWAALRATMIGTRITLFALIALIAGVIIAFFAFKTVVEELIKGIDETNAPLVAFAGALTLVGLAMVFLAGGPVAFAAALVLLAATGVAIWLEHIGALDAFRDKFDEVIATIEDTDNLLVKVAIVLSAIDLSLSALGERIGEELGKAMTVAFFDFWQEWVEGSAFDDVITAIWEGNLEALAAAGLELAKKIVAGFLGFLLGTDGLAAITGTAIKDMPKTAVTEALIAGGKVGDAFRDAFVEAFEKDLVSGIIDAIGQLGIIGKIVADILRGAITGKEQGRQEIIDREQREHEERNRDPFSTDPNFPNTPTPAFPSTNPDPEPTAIDPEPQENIFADIRAAFERLNDFLKPVEEEMELMDEILLPLVEEILPEFQTELITSTVSITDMDESLTTSKTKLDSQIVAVKKSTVSTLANQQGVNFLTGRQAILRIHEDLLTLETAREINMVIDLQIATQSLSIALTKMAIEGTEAARRISTLRVSSSGVFSMSGRQTTTTFDEIPDLVNQVNKILATEIGEKIDLAGLASAQGPKTVNVGDIVVTVSTDADPEAIAAAIQKVLNEEVDSTSLAVETRA